VPTGTARLVELARALSISPKVLLLDEPCSGLDDSESEALAPCSAASPRRPVHPAGRAHTDLVLKICDHIYVLDFGEIIASGSPEVIRSRPGRPGAYLGHLDAPETGPQLMRATILTTAPAVRFEGVRASYGGSRPSTGWTSRCRRQHLRRARAERAASRRCSKWRAASCGRRRTLKIEGLSVRRVSPEAFAPQRRLRHSRGRGVFPNLSCATTCRCDVPGTGRPEAESGPTPLPPTEGTGADRLRHPLGRRAADAAIAGRWFGSPRLLLLDEISMGLAPMVVGELYELVAHIAGDGRHRMRSWSSSSCRPLCGGRPCGDPAPRPGSPQGAPTRWPRPPSAPTSAPRLSSPPLTPRRPARRGLPARHIREDQLVDAAGVAEVTSGCGEGPEALGRVTHLEAPPLGPHRSLGVGLLPAHRAEHAGRHFQDVGCAGLLAKASSSVTGHGAWSTEPSCHQLQTSSVTKGRNGARGAAASRGRPPGRCARDGVSVVVGAVGTRLDELEVVVTEGPEERFGPARGTG